MRFAQTAPVVPGLVGASPWYIAVYVVLYNNVKPHSYVHILKRSIFINL